MWLARSLLLAVWLPAAWGQTPPDPAEQGRILNAVTAFARDYLARLPDFTCVRTTKHFKTPAGSSDWKLQVTVAQELSYYSHNEHYKTVQVNGVPKSKPPLHIVGAGYYESAGHFGDILNEIFAPRSQAQFQWKSHDYVRGKRAQVFSYRVAKAHSGAATQKCSMWLLFETCKSTRYGYHGLLFIDADSLDILRVTNVADDVPKSFPGGTSTVDYDRITVAENQYLLPIADQSQTVLGKTDYRNDAEYGSYRKFVAESSVLTSDVLPPSSAPPKPVARPNEPAPLQAAHYFDLRDALATGKAPPIARGMVEAAFNDWKHAEKDLQSVIRSSPDSDEAAIAHELLATSYSRAGHLAKAIEHLDALMAARSDDADLKETRQRLAALAKYPEQSVETRAWSRMKYEPSDEALTIPVTVNGTPAQFGLDTGAAVSAIGESLAHALNVTVHDDTFSMTDLAGKRIPCHMGVIDRLQAGKSVLRNVPVCVLPETLLSEEEGGILGLPVLLAWEAIRWNTDGDFEIGFPATRSSIRESNLCFDGGALVAEVGFDGRRLNFELDTGNPETFLFPDFSVEWRDSFKPAGVEQYELGGLGGAVNLKASRIAELPLRVAGRETLLRSVAALSESPGETCSGCYGNGGMDLFGHARTVTLDFRAMKLTLEGVRWDPLESTCRHASLSIL